MQLEVGLRRRLAMWRTAQVAEAAPTRACAHTRTAHTWRPCLSVLPNMARGLRGQQGSFAWRRAARPGPLQNGRHRSPGARTSPERERPSLSVRVKVLYLSAPSIRRPSRASSSLRSAPGRRRSSASAENTLPSAAASSVYTSGESRPAARPASAATAARTRSMRLSALWTSGTVPRTPAEKHW